MKKTSENIWKLCDKLLTFAPAFRKEAARVDILTKPVQAQFLSFPSLSHRETTRGNERNGALKKLPKTFGRY